MAKIGAMPSLATIDGFRGVLDYYVRDGQAIVRSWPQWKIPHRASAVQAQNQIFSYANQASVNLSSEVVASWKWLAAQSNLTWRDWLNRAYIGGTLAAPGEPPI